MANNSCNYCKQAIASVPEAGSEAISVCSDRNDVKLEYLACCFTNDTGTIYLDL